MKTINDWEIDPNEFKTDDGETLFADLGNGFPQEVYRDEKGRWRMENGDLIEDEPYFVIQKFSMPSDHLHLPPISTSAPPIS